MKKFLQIPVCLSLLAVMLSCASVYRPLSENQNDKVIGNIQTTFVAEVTESIITGERVYIALLEAAKKEYHGNVDIADITWSKVRTVFDPETSIVLGNEYSAHGRVILLDSNVNTRRGIEGSLARAAEQLMASLHPSSIIAIVYIMSADADTTAFITGELEYLMVNGNFTVVDRRDLDKIRQEQNFQLSGEVDDDTAVSIGKITGANIIITGSVTGSGETRSLRLRALHTETSQVMAAASEQF